MANAITKLMTFFKGELVGADQFGNRYYQEKVHKNSSKTLDKRVKRWIVYANNQEEASLVPASHYNWLHYTSDEFPREESLQYAWQKPHQANMTGTIHAYRPDGHLFEGGKRAKATGDYEAWQPE